MVSPTELSILMLDDSEDLLQVMAVYVRRFCQCNAITIKSVRELEALGEKAIACSIAILDINLGPGEPNGVEAYHWLRRNGYTKPIYFLTGHARTYPPVAEAERLGDAKVLSKPLAACDFNNIFRGLRD